MERLFLEYIDKKQKEFTISFHQIWLKSENLYYYNDYIQFLNKNEEYRIINSKKSFGKSIKDADNKYLLFINLGKYKFKQIKIIPRNYVPNVRLQLLTKHIIRPSSEYYIYTYNIINRYVSAIRNNIIGDEFFKKLKSIAPTSIDKINYEKDILLKIYHLLNTTIPSDAIFLIVSYLSSQSITDTSKLDNILYRNMVLPYKIIYKKKRPSKKDILSKINI